MALKIEFIDKAIAGSCNVVVLHVVLHRERHEQLVLQNLHIERRETGRQVRVGEATYLIEVLIEYVDATVAEVGRVQFRAVVGLRDGESLVDRAKPKLLAASAGLIDWFTAMIESALAAGFQPEMVPSSVANRKVAGDPFCKEKAPDEAKELNTWPVGAEGPSPGLAGAMVTGGITLSVTPATVRPSMLVRPVPLSEIQNGLVGP